LVAVIGATRAVAEVVDMMIITAMSGSTIMMVIVTEEDSMTEDNPWTIRRAVKS